MRAAKDYLLRQRYIVQRESVAARRCDAPQHEAELVRLCWASPPQRQRLFVEHGLDRRPRGCRIEPVLRDEILAVSRDCLDVLQELQPLEIVVVMNPHAFADDLQHVHDAEWIIALVRAQLAVVGMRSEEHTSELQSPVHLVCRLLLEKKNKHSDVWTMPKQQAYYH